MGQPAVLGQDIAVDEQQDVSVGRCRAEVLERVILQPLFDMDAKLEGSGNVAANRLLILRGQSAPGDNQNLRAGIEVVEEAAGFGRQRARPFGALQNIDVPISPVEGPMFPGKSFLCSKLTLMG